MPSHKTYFLFRKICDQSTAKFHVARPINWCQRRGRKSVFISTSRCVIIEPNCYLIPISTSPLAKKPNSQIFKKQCQRRCLIQTRTPGLRNKWSHRMLMVKDHWVLTQHTLIIPKLTPNSVWVVPCLRT
ncbi:hypothetical protein ACB094_08G100000 [Castanea mollissima]